MVSAPVKVTTAAKHIETFSMVGWLGKILGRACFTDGSTCYRGTTQKWKATLLQFGSGIILKDIGECKSSQCVELWAVHMVIQFVWE